MIKVIAQYQIYLDYFLPRASDWEKNGINIKLTSMDMIISIIPRSMDEPLFPDPTDEILSSMVINIKAVDKFDNDPGFEFKPKIFDRVTLQLFFNVDSEAELTSQKFRDEKLLTSIRQLNYFLEHCRAESLSPFVHLIPIIYMPEENRSIINVPHTETYFDQLTGNALNIFSTPKGFFNSNCRSGEFAAPESGSISFDQVCSSLLRGAPDVVKLLLADSFSFVRSERLREAIFLAATAFEVQADRLLDVLNEDQYSSINDIEKNRSKSIVEKRLNLIPQLVFGERFPDEVTYLKVIYLYRTRNKVSHEAKLYFCDNDNNEIVPDNFQVHEMIVATTQAILWLGQKINICLNQTRAHE